MTYQSPLSLITGTNQQIAYNPLDAVENHQLNIDDGSGNRQHSLHEILALHVDQKLKLPVEIRNVLIQVINPGISLDKKLELPFTTANNELAIEIFWGQKRIISFFDPMMKGLLRVVEIPYDSSDPETHIKPLTTINS